MQTYPLKDTSRHHTVAPFPARCADFHDTP